eukprot:tig00000863_g5009.t1
MSAGPAGPAAGFGRLVGVLSGAGPTSSVLKRLAVPLAAAQPDESSSSEDEQVANSSPGGGATAGSEGTGAQQASTLAPGASEQLDPAPSRRGAPLSLPPPPPLYDFSQDQSELYNGIPVPKTGVPFPLIMPPPRHIIDEPAEPEPLAVQRENLIQDMIAHDLKRQLAPEKVLNRIVYDCIEPPPRFKEKAAPELPPGRLHAWWELEGADDRTLLFESRFESGNLRRAIQIYPEEYDLILRPDINTRGHTQWYYFQIKNARKGVKYKFNVINMVKSDSLYNQGMRPLFYSERMAQQGVGWRRWGEDVCYYQNQIKRNKGYYFTLTFKMEFPHEEDACYLAYCQPYTFTDLQTYLKALEDDPKRRNRMRRRVLCQTLAGNNCDLLTITSFACDPEALKARKGIVVTGRVHPGESNSSWMMKGFIDYLTGPSLDAKILRDNFVFKIVPMLNPDGVINGNHRCSLAGCDLNRQWIDPSKRLNPTIYCTKMMIKRFTEDRQVVLFVDLHGHSRKKNIFIYGCENRANLERRLRERIFPRILWKNAHDFSFADCAFKVQKSKEGTGRVVVWRDFNIVNSYTMEASFCGASFGRHCSTQFHTRHLEEMGHFFCDTILDFYDPDQSKVQAVLRELEALYPLRAYSGADDSGADDNGSDSDAESEEETLDAAAAAAAAVGDVAAAGRATKAMFAAAAAAAAAQLAAEQAGNGGKAGAAGGAGGAAGGVPPAVPRRRGSKKGLDIMENGPLVVPPPQAPARHLLLESAGAGSPYGSFPFVSGYANPSVSPYPPAFRGDPGGYTSYAAIVAAAGAAAEPKGGSPPSGTPASAPSSASSLVASREVTAALEAAAGSLPYSRAVLSRISEQVSAFVSPRKRPATASAAPDPPPPHPVRPPEGPPPPPLPSATPPRPAPPSPPHARPVAASRRPTALSLPAQARPPSAAAAQPPMPPAVEKERAGSARGGSLAVHTPDAGPSASRYLSVSRGAASVGTVSPPAFSPSGAPSSAPLPGPSRPLSGGSSRPLSPQPPAPPAPGTYVRHRDRPARTAPRSPPAPLKQARRESSVSPGRRSGAPDDGPAPLVPVRAAAPRRRRPPTRAQLAGPSAGFGMLPRLFPRSAPARGAPPAAGLAAARGGGAGEREGRRPPLPRRLRRHRPPPYSPSSGPAARPPPGAPSSKPGPAGLRSNSFSRSPGVPAGAGGGQGGPASGPSFFS